MPELAIRSDISTAAKSLPQPGIGLVVTSVLFMGGCLSVAGFGLALVLLKPDYFLLIVGALLGVWPLWLAQLEYRGTFRGEFAASRVINHWWLLLAGFLAIQVISGPFFLSRGQQAAVHFVVGTLLLLCVAVGHFLRRDWVRQLRPALKKGAIAQKPWKFTLREMFLLMGAAAVLLGVCSACLRFWSAGFAEHVRPDQCPFELPAGASDVSYYVGGQQRAFEFTIAEAGFEEWAAGLDLYEFRLPRGTYEMRRYGSLHPTLSRNNSVDIEVGWYSEGYVDGRKTSIAFDRASKRAYFYSP